MTLDDAQTKWQQCLVELQLQMAQATFNTSLHGSRVMDVHNSTITVGIRYANATDWLVHRLKDRVILPTARRIFADQDLDIAFTADADWGRAAAPNLVAASPIGAADAGEISEISTIPIPNAILDFNPNTADTGGFSQIGNYANIYWATFLGIVPWRIYCLVFADDKRKKKTIWTRPLSYTISALARAVPCSRNAIRGRWRTTDETRVWRPGAFDALTLAGIAHVEWHDNNPHWRRWLPGGFYRGDSTGQRIIYRLSVLTILPLLTPHQVAQLPADLRADHERYLSKRDVDLFHWERINRLTLGAGLDKRVITGVRTPDTGAGAPVGDSFFPNSPGTGETE